MMIEQLRDKPLYALSVGEFTELVNSLFAMQQAKEKETVELSRFVNTKGAAELTGKTTNAIRVQISLGNLKSIKKGSRHYFEREYLEQWILGSVNNGGAIND
jgi:hypothetical protein